jgi:hypothetical protein
MRRGNCLIWMGLACLVAGCLAWPLRNASKRPAPDTEGIDSHGVALRLSDYRGKVVLLDFWGLS